MKQFSDLGLAERILQAVSAEGYTKPTPIQAQVIPAMLAGRDIVGIAQTGTGKTAAFVLPLLHRISNQRARPDAKCCSTLILAPTRELAAQIADAITTYGRFVRHSKAVVIGGAKPGPQIRALAQGVDIVIATPGRLEDHLSTGALRLDRATTVILDEADQMMDLGFMPAIRRIMARLPRRRQTLLLSATMPRQIRALASDFLVNPAEISVAPGSRPIERIDQKLFFVDRAAKRRLLADILGGADVRRAIVFTRTKRGADRVMLHLQRAGLAAAAIHGNKSQRQRERTLAAFRSGSVKLLVATDIAARGIDVDDISHVVNYELPNIPEAYVHRIGRTARAGKSGVAISLCDGTERGYLRDIEKLIGAPLAKENAVIEGRSPAHESRHEPEAQIRVPREKGPARGKGQTRHGKKSRHRGKPGAARPMQRNGSKPGDQPDDAGLARMLTNVGGQQKRSRVRGRRAGASSHRQHRSF